MLELYHAEPGANSMKPMLCLKEKGIEFVSRYIDFRKFEQHDPEFVKINPNGQVPVLVHDGRIITESTVINEYIEDVFPGVPLRPVDPYFRAQMRVWTKFIDEYYCPALSMIGWHLRVRNLLKDMSQEEIRTMLEKVPLEEQKQKWATVAGESFTEEQLADSRRRLKVSLDRHEERLRKWKWLAGPEYSLADVDDYPMTAAMPRLFPEIFNDKDTPRSVGWLQRMNDRPAVKAALAMARYAVTQPLERAKQQSAG